MAFRLLFPCLGGWGEEVVGDLRRVCWGRGGRGDWTGERKEARGLCWLVLVGCCGSGFGGGRSEEVASAKREWISGKETRPRGLLLGWVKLSFGAGRFRKKAITNTPKMRNEKRLHGANT